MENCSKSNCPAQHKAEVFTPANQVAYAEGAVVSRTIIENGGGTVTLFSFDANQGLSEHTAPFDAMVCILDGEARITIGGKPHHLKTGESIIMPANVPHALDAVTAFKMMLIMIKAYRLSGGVPVFRQKQKIIQFRVSPCASSIQAPRLSVTCRGK